MSNTIQSGISYSERRIINNRIRRNKELKRHIMIFILSIILFFVLVISLFSIKGIASNGSEKEIYKYYTSIQIKAGDSLTSLAETYVNPEVNDTKKFIKEVCFINNMCEEDFLYSGNYIIVPCYDTLKR